MGKLSSKARANLPSKDFAGPGRSFPIENKAHARAALIDVGKAKGLDSSEKAHIKAVAREMLRSHSDR